VSQKTQLVPRFGLKGNYTTFQDEKVKNMLLSMLRDLMTLSQTPESDEERMLPPHSPRLGTQGRLVLLLSWYPTFETKVTPWLLVPRERFVLVASIAFGYEMTCDVVNGKLISASTAECEYMCIYIYI